MAHESFEDPAIAALMNEHFINIKLDREERPISMPSTNTPSPPRRAGRLPSPCS